MLAGLPLGQAALLPTPRKTPLIVSGGYHLLVKVLNQSGDEIVIINSKTQ